MTKSSDEAKGNHAYLGTYAREFDRFYEANPKKLMWEGGGNYLNAPK